MHTQHTAIQPRRGFTMIELLVVIVVISLLITMIVTVAGRVVYNQKVALTQTVQQNTIIAIEEFATIDPLKARYNTNRTGVRPTFGPYPAYPLFGDGGGDRRVNDVLEPDWARPDDLDDRLTQDLYGSGSGNEGNVVELESNDESNDDMRALFTYLKVKTPAGLARIPDRFLRPMTDNPTNKDLVDPHGVGTRSSEAFSVLGIHDAWGVPMDYFLYVKLEAVVLTRGDDRGDLVWRVVDRKPVLRSLGISREEYDTARKTPGMELDDSKWIFSESFPSPDASAGRPAFWKTGNLRAADRTHNGWARAISAGDAERGGKRVFGFVPDPERDK